jgi:hypothetical protein
MTSSKWIAGLLGPTMIAIGAALLINLGSMNAMVAQVARDQALIFVSGTLLLVAGVAIVRVHNVWSGGWPVVVTIIGWIMVLSGLARMLFPFHLARLATQIGASRALLVGSAIFLLLLGGFLSYKAYSRD